MNELFTEIGYRSLNKYGEELCGDNVAVVEQNDSSLAVLAHGLGSGVKANILSTLCSKIISTMLSANMSIENCVSTIASTLPVCSVRGVAYSTFTIMRTVNEDYVEIIRYDNPPVIVVRDGEILHYDEEEMNIENRKIYISKFSLQDGDLFVAVSDGAPHAGVGRALNFGWEIEHIADFIKNFSHVGFSAKTLCTILTDECNKLYGYKPGDDTTALIFRVRKRVPINILIGPPANREDDAKMMSLFFSKAGKHIVCGGTTSKIAANYLGKEVKIDLSSYSDPTLPPVAKVEGIDHVTEGVITINTVLDYAKDYLQENRKYQAWSSQNDGASVISRLLFEEATDINFFVGMAVNPAHQNPDLPIQFNFKMSLTDELSSCLSKMGKFVKINHF